MSEMSATEAIKLQYVKPFEPLKAKCLCHNVTCLQTNAMNDPQIRGDL